MALEFQGVLEKTDKVVDDNDMGKCVAGHVGYSAVIRYLLEGAQNNHHVLETCSENPERTDIRDLWIPDIFPQDQAEPRKMAAEKKEVPQGQRNRKPDILRCHGVGHLVLRMV